MKDSKNYKWARKEAYLELISLVSTDMMIPKTKHMQIPWYSRGFKNIGVHNAEQQVTCILKSKYSAESKICLTCEWQKKLNFLSSISKNETEDGPVFFPFPSFLIHSNFRLYTKFQYYFLEGEEEPTEIFNTILNRINYHSGCFS